MCISTKDPSLCMFMHVSTERARTLVVSSVDQEAAPPPAIEKGGFRDPGDPLLQRQGAPETSREPRCRRERDPLERREKGLPLPWVPLCRRETWKVKEKGSRDSAGSGAAAHVVTVPKT